MIDAYQFLPVVRTALRLRTTAYDEELILYIDHVLEEFRRVGVEDCFSSTAINCVIAYVKSQFGNADAEKKEAWTRTYDRILVGMVV